MRELRNVLRRALAMAQSDVLRPVDFAVLGHDRSTPLPMGGGQRVGATDDRPLPEVSEGLPIKEARERWVAPMEREYLLRLLTRCEGDLDRAAAEAGIHRKSLERLLRQHSLKASDLRKG